MVSRLTSSKRLSIVSSSRGVIRQPRPSPLALPISCQQPIHSSRRAHTRSHKKISNPLTLHISADLTKHAKEGNTARFQRLKAMIDNPNSLEDPATLYRTMGGSSASPAVSNPAPYTSQAKPNPTPAYNAGGGPAATYRIIGHPSKFFSYHSLHDLTLLLGIEFKSSPYFIVEEQLGGPTSCESK